jgi:hypothetical protein
MRSLGYGAAVAVLTAASGSAATAQGLPPVSQPVPVTVSPAPLTELVGTWDAITRSYGGIGSTVLFSGDSVFALVLGAMVDVKYKVNGDEFTIFGEERGNRFSETQKLKFIGDTAVLSARGCSMKLTPFETGTAAGSLVGKWRMIHLTGVPAYEEFSPDGVARLRVPIQVQKGKYSVTGDTIVFHTITPRSEDWTAEFFLTGDTLTVSNAAGLHRYLRARQLIPLDVQQPAPPARMLCRF